MLNRVVTFIGAGILMACSPNEAASQPPPAIGDHVVIIARWDSPQSQEITVQNFIQDGQSFIPVFSDEQTFRREAAGSGFENQGVEIRVELLADMLHGDEVLILNPGSDSRRLTPADIRATAERSE